MFSVIEAVIESQKDEKLTSQNDVSFKEK